MSDERHKKPKKKKTSTPWELPEEMRGERAAERLSDTELLDRLFAFLRSSSDDRVEDLSGRVGNPGLFQELVKVTREATARNEDVATLISRLKSYGSEMNRLVGELDDLL